jgi:hypothetical protein
LGKRASFHGFEKMVTALLRTASAGPPRSTASSTAAASTPLLLHVDAFQMALEGTLATWVE